MKSRSPLVWALWAGLAVLAAAFVPVLLQMWRPQAQAPAVRSEMPAPWQIELGAAGELRAFGLRLPGSTLADAQARWGDDLQVAVIASRGLPAALEAYTDRWKGGGVTGRLVLASDAQQAAVARWQDRSPKREIIDADAQRWPLRADDKPEALRSAVVGLSFLPSSRVDADLLEARFGRAAQRLVGEGRTRHWLYPERGLAIAWDEASGKAVMQVVAPADFQRRLLAPLQAAAVTAPAASPGSGPPR